MDKVAIGRVVLTNREHIIALEPLDKGLMGTLLRYPYEVRDPQEYFDDIQDVKVTKDTLQSSFASYRLLARPRAFRANLRANGPTTIRRWTLMIVGDHSCSPGVPNDRRRTCSDIPIAP